MKRLTCEMCGSTDLIKQDGVFVCQSCGCKYSVEEAKKMMIEGTVEVTGTVKVDNTAAIDNYLDMARNAQDAGNNDEADEYCNKIIEMDVTNWEAWFIKGKAVGWQSTLANIRVPETVNAFSKALDNCPEEKKEEITKKCQEELEKLNVALLSLRVRNFSTHPGIKDLEGLQHDIQSILGTTATFLSKAGVLVDIDNIKYGITITLGMVTAFNKIYKEYLGDDNHPSDYAFRRFISEGDILLKGFDIALILLGDDYNNKEKNDLIITIYNNMIKVQEIIRDACSYEASFSGGFKSYNKKLTLTGTAKAARNSEISTWKSKITEIQTVGRKRAEEAAQKRRDEYWAEHIEEKKKLEEEKNKLEFEKQSLQNQISSLIEEKESVPAKEDLKNIQDRISSLIEQKKGLGLFKGKEKRAVQERIDTAMREADERKEVVKTQQENVEKRISPLRTALHNATERIKEIDHELSKDR